MQKITDKSLPFYTESKLLSAELTVTDTTSEFTFEVRNKKILISLGRATTLPEGQKLYENFAKKYVNNGIFCNT